MPATLAKGGWPAKGLPHPEPADLSSITRRLGRNDAGLFAHACDEIAVAIDAGKVNTVGGWRHVKVVVCKRTQAPLASAGDWENRKLPAATAQVVVVAIEDAATLAIASTRWRPRT